MMLELSKMIRAVDLMALHNLSIQPMESSLLDSMVTCGPVF